MSATAVLEGSDRARMLADYAELRRDVVKDKAYRLTPIGALAGKHLDELTFESYAERTVEGREQILAWLALDYADKQPEDVTTDDLKAFLSLHWKDAARNTKATCTSHVRAFFAWAFENDHLRSDPGRRLKAPRQQDTERIAHSTETVRALIAGQASLRDRCGILLLYWCGLRRNELRLIQYRHLDLGNRTLIVFGKGGKVLEQSLPSPLALEIERLIHRVAPAPDEYVLHPQRLGRYGSYPAYSYDVIWEDRTRPYASSGIDRWWQRCVKNAGIPHFPMHELRHTAGTHFHQTGHDLVATQHFLRHANPATTARTYVHLDRVRAVADVQRTMLDPMEDA